MRTAIMSLVLLMCGSLIASAQTTADFSKLPLKIGETIYVTNLTTGIEVKGPLRAVSASSLAIDGYLFESGDRLKIERPGDSIWDGAAIGFGVGSLLGVSIGAEACLHSPVWHCAVAGGVTYGSLGALIDWVHKGRRTIYTAGSRRSIALVPDVARSRKRVTVAWSFR